ncbi:MAG: hypothetical protein MH252_07130 [Thermosynechococcaceae cyanobacterium MS004]|nr:hypothetical protein [Thermosynechococcaceae cyanobacterium MS004]
MNSLDANTGEAGSLPKLSSTLPAPAPLSRPTNQASPESHLSLYSQAFPTVEIALGIVLKTM